MDFHCKWSPPSRAAWIEIAGYRRTCRHGASPPSRAAWIEIPVPLRPSISPTSPPSRAAWIEIVRIVCGRVVRVVAAFTGGVD